MIQLRPNQKRASNAIMVLWFSLGAAVLMLLVEFYTYYTFNSGYLDYDSLMFFSVVVGLAGIVTIGATIAAAITFIQWFRRAYFNMHMLVPSTSLKYTEGWAAGAWFIPIFNWFGPYQIAKDMIQHATRLLTNKGLVSNGVEVSKVAGIWWGLWVASSVLGQIDYRLSDNVNEVSLVFSVLSSIASIAAAYYAIQYVKKYSEWEELLPQAVEDAEVKSSFSEGQSDLLDSSM